MRPSPGKPRTRRLRSRTKAGAFRRPGNGHTRAGLRDGPPDRLPPGDRASRGHGARAAHGIARAVCWDTSWTNIAIGSGRAAWRGFRRRRRLLAALMQGQQAGTVRIDETTRRLLPARFVVGDADGGALLFAEAGGSGPERPRRWAAGDASGGAGAGAGPAHALREECVRDGWRARRW